MNWLVDKLSRTFLLVVVRIHSMDAMTILLHGFGQCRTIVSPFDALHANAFAVTPGRQMTVTETLSP